MEKIVICDTKNKKNKNFILPSVIPSLMLFLSFCRYKFLIYSTFLSLKQWSPTFLAPGTGFLEDSFSTDRWSGEGDNASNVCVGGGGSGGHASDGEQRGAADEASLRSPAAHLLLCDPVPNRPQTTTGVWPGGGDPCSKELLLLFIARQVYWQEIPLIFV